MKCLFISLKKWESEVTHLASRGKHITHDPIREERLLIEDACAVLITYEESDSIEMLELIASEVEKEAKDLGRSNILITPFAHLSSHIGEATEAREFLECLTQLLKNNGFNAIREHFGSDKEVELILNSHPGCVRFREY